VDKRLGPTVSIMTKPNFFVPTQDLSGRSPPSLPCRAYNDGDMSQMQVRKSCRAGRNYSPSPRIWPQTHMQPQVNAVRHLPEPHFLEKLGPVLRTATEDITKEDLPPVIGHLLARLHQLEAIGRLRQRPETEEC
jgi:hypothetical protein